METLELRLGTENRSLCKLIAAGLMAAALTAALTYGALELTGYVMRNPSSIDTERADELRSLPYQAK